MFSAIFFIIAIALLSGMLLETLGDELRVFAFRFLDNLQGNHYEKQLREIHRTHVRKV